MTIGQAGRRMRAATKFLTKEDSRMKILLLNFISLPADAFISFLCMYDDRSVDMERSRPIIYELVGSEDSIGEMGTLADGWGGSMGDPRVLGSALALAKFR